MHDVKSKQYARTSSITYVYTLCVDGAERMLCRRGKKWAFSEDAIDAKSIIFKNAKRRKSKIFKKKKTN